MTIIFLFLGLLLLLFTGIPIFAALILYSGGLLLAVQGNLGSLGSVIFSDLNQYLLVAIPLFAFMAHIMINGKVVDDLYYAAHTFTRHLPGGLAVATILACTIFAAISGSSVATALTIGAVAIPQMLNYGYPPHMAYGAVAAGGTLGILIPPSSPLILYGITSDASIGGLFMAGLIPGLLMALVLMSWSVLRSDKSMARDTRATGKEMLQAFRKSIWSLVLPVFVLGGMYAGIFTATEAAAAGVWLALVVAVLIYRTVGWRAIWKSAQEACLLSAMLFMILAGAAVFSHILTKMNIPQNVVAYLAAADLGPTAFIVVMMLIILVLGMFLEAVAIILVTTPVILPAMIQLEIDPIWYGILLVINLEIAMITPPVGMNLFTIKAITHARMGTIIRGSAPYVLLMMLMLLVVLFWPELATWLPTTMRN